MKISKKKLAAGVAASAAMYLGAAPADAAIVTNTDLGLAPIFATGNGSILAEWDVDGTGNSEFVLNVTFSSSIAGMGFFSSSRNGNGCVQATGSGSLAVRNLAPGHVIGGILASGYQFGSRGGHSVTYSGDLDNNFNSFSSGTDGYIGFKFDPGGDTLYGWARVNITVANSPSHAFNILEWAYEDSGSSIEVPAAVVPEPTTAVLGGLALLACGASGVRRWRKDRAV